MNENWTVSELLLELDGAGLVITDQDGLERELEYLGFSGNSLVEKDCNTSKENEEDD